MTAAASPRRPIDLRLLLRMAIGLAIYAICWSRVPPDMIAHLLPWFREILGEGRIGAFAEPFSNYTPPYLYLLSASTLLAPVLPAVTIIKLLSVLCTALLAWSVFVLLRACKVERPGLPALAVFVLPSAIVNAPLLGQCDALWTSFCVLSVAAAVEHRHVRMLIFAGIAFAIKAQAAFFAPLVLAVLIGRRVPLHYWLIPVAAYLALMLPAILAGWPIGDIVTVYARQAEWRIYGGNLANPWIFYRFLPVAEGAGTGFWIGYTAALGFIGAFLALFPRMAFTPRRIVAGALLAAFVLPYLLPMMHERFWFLADILAYALALIGRDRRTLAIVLAVQASSCFALLGYIIYDPIPAMLGAPVAALAIMLILRELRDTATANRHAAPVPLPATA